MYVKYLDLYLGHPQACQHKDRIRENTFQGFPFWILVSIDGVILTGRSNPDGSHLVVFITKQATHTQSVKDNTDLF